MARCTGYRGVFYCKEVYPDGNLPESMFTESILKKGVGTCKICKKVNDRTTTNYNKPFYWAIAGGRKAYYALNAELRKLCRISADYGGVIPPPRKRVVSYDNTAPERKSVTSKQYIRDRNVVNHIRSVYGSCIMPGCGYRDVDVAHIHALKHGAKDVPENCIPLCPNHHRDLDRGRLHFQYLSPKSIAVRTQSGAYIGEIRSRHTLDEDSIKKAMTALAPYMEAA
jgi:hypothetical protein